MDCVAEILFYCCVFVITEKTLTSPSPHPHTQLE